MQLDPHVDQHAKCAFPFSGGDKIVDRAGMQHSYAPLDTNVALYLHSPLISADDFLILPVERLLYRTRKCNLRTSTPKC